MYLNEKIRYLLLVILEMNILILERELKYFDVFIKAAFLSIIAGCLCTVLSSGST